MTKFTIYVLNKSGGVIQKKHDRWWNMLSKSYILTVSDGIFWVSPIYLLYLMECFKFKGKGRVTGKW
jgi:hypothetical protein